MGRKKKVAKKDKAVFRLVHRSQHDPTAGGEGTSRVLVPMNENAYRQYDEIYQQKLEEEEENDGLPPPQDCDEDFLDDEVFEGEEGEEILRELDEGKGKGKGKEKEDDVKKPSGEGVSYDYNKNDYEFAHLGIGGDGYDYSKYMKPAGTGDVFIPVENAKSYRKPKASKDDLFFLKEDKPQLPSDAFASVMQGDTKLLHLQNFDSKPFLDKDILHFLEEEDVSDSEFDGFDGELEDDFITLAEGGEDAEFGEFGTGRKGGLDPNFVPHPDDMYSEDENFDDDEGPPELEDYEDEEDKTVDPVMMSERQKDLEEQFQNVLEMYDEEEIGELDPEDPRLHGKKEIDDPRFEGVLDEHIESTGRQLRFGLDALDEDEDEASKQQLAARLKALNLPRETVQMALESGGVGQQWDCQSITSLYSNTENHPTMIDEPKQIKLSSKTGIPLGYLGQHAAKRKPSRLVEEEEYDDDSEEEEDEEVVNLGEKRPKKESAEDKRARKQAAKKAKQEARIRKKETRQEFSREKTRQMSAQAKNSLNQQSQIRM